MFWIVLGLALAEPLQGEVSTTTGGAIADAYVDVEDYQSGEHIDTVRTDAAGRWHLDLPRGSYRLRVSKPGFRTNDRPVFVAPVDGAQVTVLLPSQPELTQP
jgi:hypothetical protein